MTTAMIHPPRPRHGRLAGAAAGIAAAAAALAVSELAAAILGAPSLVLAIGARIIDLQPAGAKDFVVALFGESDKLALEVGIVAAALAIAAGLGIAATRRFWVGALGFAIAGVAGFVAAAADPQAIPFLAATSAILTAGAGIAVLSWLTEPIREPAWPTMQPPASMETPNLPSMAPSPAAPSMPDWDRRTLLRSGAVIGVSLLVGVAGRRLLTDRRTLPTVAADLPPPTATAPPMPAGAEFAVDGLTPLVVPNPDFYRIDTALFVPRVELATWTLRVHGLVEREVVLDWPTLLALPTIEQYVTIACVSNEVGGRLVGNAKWTGVRLREVLAMAGPLPGASQLVGRSADDWTAGMPLAWVLDEAREPLIAIAMNDEPLPLDHGWPARLIVPGLYGYVSATKWLTELELTTMEAFDGYWVPLGWAKEAPILTQSRIDVPRDGARLTRGTVAVAGVAWAPDRGIRGVEVAIDGGDWQPAEISTPISDATWVQWRYRWEATPGGHAINVRATDGLGEVQTAQRSRPAPDGARGHHAIRVDVD